MNGQKTRQEVSLLDYILNGTKHQETLGKQRIFYSQSFFSFLTSTPNLKYSAEFCCVQQRKVKSNIRQIHWFKGYTQAGKNKEREKAFFCNGGRIISSTMSNTESCARANPPTKKAES